MIDAIDDTGIAAKCFVQSASLIRITASPAVASAAVNKRPMTGAVGKFAKMSGDRLANDSISGSGVPVSVPLPN